MPLGALRRTFPSTVAARRTGIVLRSVDAVAACSAASIHGRRCGASYAIPATEPWHRRVGCPIGRGSRFAATRCWLTPTNSPSTCWFAGAYIVAMRPSRSSGCGDGFMTCPPAAPRFVTGLHRCAVSLDTDVVRTSLNCRGRSLIVRVWRPKIVATAHAAPSRERVYVKDWRVARSPVDLRNAGQGCQRTLRCRGKLTGGDLRLAPPQCRSTPHLRKG